MMPKFYEKCSERVNELITEIENRKNRDLCDTDSINE